MIYLDYAAATPLDSDVLAAMQPFFAEQFYNPSATYLPAQHVRNSLENARQDVASCLGARTNEIIFTAGGSESDNLAIAGIMQQFPGKHVVVSAVEHDAVLEPAMQFSSTLAPVDAEGRIDLRQLEESIKDDTVLVSVMYANNEVGTIQPLHKIATVLRTIRDERKRVGNALPLYFHTDACQAANYLDLHVARLGVDLMTLNGGKIYGPKQSGVLFVASHVRLQPIIRGGGQERNLRSGTENVSAHVGFATALLQVQMKRREESDRLSSIQKNAFETITDAVPWSVLNGSIKHRLPNNIHITLPGTDNERVLLELEQQGILGAAGSACSASDDEPSHVLRAMGISDTNAQASLRFTMGRSTSEDDISKMIEALRIITKDTRSDKR